MNNAGSRPMRPNVLFIIADDLTWGDLAGNGNPWTTTPHIDGLRAAGASLEQYRSGPLCTPARAAIMTGRYAYRTRAIDTYCGRTTLDPDERTLAEMFRDAGYRTSLSGKWHLGDNHPSRPQDKGFDEVLMHLGGGLRQPANFGADGYFDPDLVWNGRLRSCTGFCTDIFTDHAIDCIRSADDRPFFAYVAFNAPHNPLEAPARHRRLLRNKGLKDDRLIGCYGMVDNIDHNVGRLLRTLGETGRSENTVVVFTSDHGAAGFNGQVRFNGGLRGQKGDPYDGGLRVPCLVRWPARIRPRRVEAMCHPIDWLPTFAAWSGGGMQGKIDGVNLDPVLTGATPDLPPRHLVHQWHRGDVPVQYRNFMITDGEFKLCRAGREDAPDELFRIREDPAEARDLAAQLPAVCDRLRIAYEQWFADVAHTRPDNYAPVPAVVGTERCDGVLLNRNDWRVEGPDGWSDETEARWPVRLARAGSHRFTVYLSPANTPVEVQLELGGIWLHQTEPAGAHCAEFATVELPAGLLSVRAASVDRQGRRRAARFVQIEAGAQGASA